MLDPVVTPILLKTIDWLFGEGSKILQERRERRSASGEAKQTSPEPVPPSSVPATTGDTIHSKDAALKSPIVEATWSDSEADITHLLSLLEIHKRNYYLAKEQYAKWGSALVPPIITHNLIEAEDQIAATTKKLQTTLSAVYGKRVAVPEVERA